MLRAATHPSILQPLPCPVSTATLQPRRLHTRRLLTCPPLLPCPQRMHLLTFLKLRQPGILFRSMVLVGQGEDSGADT